MTQHYLCKNLPKEYFFTHYQMNEADSSEFIHYNIDAFGVPITEYEDAMREIGVDEEIIAIEILKIKNDLKDSGSFNNAKGNFGESQTSYYLENNEDFIFTRYGWSENPFAGHTSIDCFGIDSSRKYVAYIEAKAALSDSSVATLISQMVTDQLHLERIHSFTKRGVTTIQAISKAYHNKISKSSKSEDPKETIDTLYQDRFMRIGVIIHKTENRDHSLNLKKLRKEELKFKKKHPEFSDVDCFPTRIIDLKNLQIQENFDHWLLTVDVLCKIRG
jgi:hypothetical protein